MSTKNQTTHSTYQFWISGVILLLSFCLRWYYLDSEPYWLDEALTTWFTEQSYHDLWNTVPHYETHPPLYYTVTKFFNSLVPSLGIYKERYLSLVLTLPIPFLLFTLLKKISTVSNRSQPPHYIFILTCLSPILTIYAIEARPYMLLSLGYAMTLTGVFLIIGTRPTRLSHWLFFTLSVALTNWSHMLGSFYSFTAYAYLFVHFTLSKERNYTFIQLILSAIVAGALTLPLVWIIIEPMLCWSGGSWVQEPDVSKLLLTLSQLFIFTTKPIGPHVYGYPVLNTSLAVMSTLILSACIFACIVKRSYHLLGLLFIAVIIPIMTFAVSYFGPNVFLFRTLTPAVIPYYVFLAGSIFLMTNITTRRLIIAVLTVQLLLCSIIDLTYQRKEPYDKIGTYLSENMDKKDTALLFPNFLMIAIEHNLINSIEGNMLSFPHDYPALGTSECYPGGSPAVPGITDNDFPKLEKIVTDTQGKILLVIRSATVYDPENLIMDKLTSRMGNPVKTKDFGYVDIYVFENENLKD